MKCRVSWRSKIFSVGMIVILALFIVACGHDDDFRNQIKETAPTITSADSTVFTVGTAGTFTVTATGNPTPTFAIAESLPSGLTFNTTTGVLSGTPAAGTNGAYPLTITASNGISPNATQNFTLTVNAASAATSWPAGVKQYGSDSTDYATGMVKDKDGNIYVTGYSSGNLDPVTCTYAGMDDIYLVKYNSSGVRQWTKMFGTVKFDRPYAIAYDGNEGIYLTGYTQGNLDGQENTYDKEVMFVTQYSTGGLRKWTKLYELAGSTAYALTWNNEHFYVSGMSNDGGGLYKFFLAKYDGVGNQEWIKYGSDGFNGLAIALDTSGNIYVTGSGMSSMFLYKFDTSGNVIWNTANESYTAGRGLVLDGSANIYFTGSTDTSEAYLVKYNTAGVLQWTNLIDSGFYSDGGNAVALDSSGNIYVTGGTTGNLNGQINNGVGAYDMFLIKYNPGGTRQWTRLLGTTAYDAGIGLALENDTYVLVYGHTQGVLAAPSAGGQDYFFAQYNSSGDLQ